MGAVNVKVMFTCPYCGDQTVPGSAVKVYTATRRAEELSYYATTCPQCKQPLRKPAPQNIRHSLLRQGIQGIEWHIPAEAIESPKVTTPIGMDEVIELHFQLAEDNYPVYTLSLEEKRIKEDNK